MHLSASDNSLDAFLGRVPAEADTRAIFSPAAVAAPGKSTGKTGDSARIASWWRRSSPQLSNGAVQKLVLPSDASHGPPPPPLVAVPVMLHSGYSHPPTSLEDSCYTLLVSALHDPRWRVSVEAARCLATVGVPRMIAYAHRQAAATAAITTPPPPQLPLAHDIAAAHRGVPSSLFRSAAVQVARAVQSGLDGCYAPLVMSGLRAALALGAAYTAYEASELQAIMAANAIGVFTAGDVSSVHEDAPGVNRPPSAPACVRIPAALAAWGGVACALLPLADAAARAALAARWNTLPASSALETLALQALAWCTPVVALALPRADTASASVAAAVDVDEPRQRKAFARALFSCSERCGATSPASSAGTSPEYDVIDVPSLTPSPCPCCGGGRGSLLLAQLFTSADALALRQLRRGATTLLGCAPYLCSTDADLSALFESLADRALLYRPKEPHNTNDAPNLVALLATRLALQWFRISVGDATGSGAAGAAAAGPAAHARPRGAAPRGPLSNAGRAATLLAAVQERADGATLWGPQEAAGASPGLYLRLAAGSPSAASEYVYSTPLARIPTPRARCGTTLVVDSWVLALAATGAFALPGPLRGLPETPRVTALESQSVPVVPSVVTSSDTTTTVDDDDPFGIQEALRSAASPSTSSAISAISSPVPAAAIYRIAHAGVTESSVPLDCNARLILDFCAVLRRALVAATRCSSNAQIPWHVHRQLDDGATRAVLKLRAVEAAAAALPVPRPLKFASHGLLSAAPVRLSLPQAPDWMHSLSGLLLSRALMVTGSRVPDASWSALSSAAAAWRGSSNGDGSVAASTNRGGTYLAEAAFDAAIDTPIAVSNGSSQRHVHAARLLAAAACTV